MFSAYRTLNNFTHRRINVLVRILNPNIQFNCVSAFSDGKTIKIGDVSKPLKTPKHPYYVPKQYLNKQVSQDVLKHLRWMMQKDILGQDIFLIGRPGPFRRNLAMKYSEITLREIEYVSLSRDTTEADLKQRREIKQGTALYFDQSAVRAAVNGRILIIEGIEKAERNVLPVLNNLLENREMNLEDGRLLIPAARYDELLKKHSQEELDSLNLIRVSEDFRVIALGLPVPKYTGNPLDPPLRSRFQAREIQNDTYKAQLEDLSKIAPQANSASLSQLLSASFALLSPEGGEIGLPDFPVESLPRAAHLLEHFPGIQLHTLLYFLYPYRLFLAPEGVQAVQGLLDTLGLKIPKKISTSGLNLISLNPSPDKPNLAIAQLTCHNVNTSMEVMCGNETRVNPDVRNLHPFIETPYHTNKMAELIASHTVGDFCLVGPRGCGKSTLVNRFAELLNYRIEPIVLYQDMTSRELLQQRRTLANGDTVWQNSPLVTAALEGKLAVVDGLHRLHPSTLAVMHRLVHDRELQLPDGSRLIGGDRYNTLLQEYDSETLNQACILRVDPAFRIIGLAEPPVRGSPTGQWINSELLSLFIFHEIRPLELKEEMQIIKQLHGNPGPAFELIMKLAHELRNSEDTTLQALSSSLTTRQLSRIAQRMVHFKEFSANDAVHRACLTRFIPTLTRQALDGAMNRTGFESQTPAQDNPALKCTVEGDRVTIGNTQTQRYAATEESLAYVPNITFYDVPQHVSILERLLQDFLLGEHLLLIGNQGVGKNKLADRLLQLLNRPREYIQLHRDTTVQTLTVQPTVVQGVVRYEDSPLVKAAKLGRVLVVDEADKAPTHVTCILKTLVESGEMILSDGRRIIPHWSARDPSDPNVILMHPDFRMIILANRPGFPFLGNDFFGALGDLFSCHAIDNPSPESEFDLLKKYGPDVSDKLIYRLVRAFGELRSLADSGHVQYPYSTREVVNIVKHLQEFPNEGLANVVCNVFDFDRHSKETLNTVIEILHKHGIPLAVDPNNVHLAKQFPLPPKILNGEWNVSRSDSYPTLPIEERMLKYKHPSKLNKYNNILDRVESRSNIFHELHSYWTLPLQESSIIGALGVARVSGISNNVLDETIYVLSVNPLTLYKMTPSKDTIEEFSLLGLMKPHSGSKPLYTILPLTGNLSDQVLIHEKTSNGILIVDTKEAQARNLSFKSFFESATNSISRGFKNDDQVFWDITPLFPDSNSLVAYEKGGFKFELINIDNLVSFSGELPFRIQSLFIIENNKLIVEDELCNKYILSKSSENIPCPNIISIVQESHYKFNPGRLQNSSVKQINDDILSRCLDQTIKAPNRLLSTTHSYATIAVGFPELEHSANEIYTWPRRNTEHRFPLGPAVILHDTAQIVQPVSWQIAKSLFTEEEMEGVKGICAFLEVADIWNGHIRYIPIPRSHNLPPLVQYMYGGNNLPIYLAATNNEDIITLDMTGCLRIWETNLNSLARSLHEWKELIGSDRQYLQMSVESHSGKDVSTPKHGKVDPTGDPHVGGNTWAGGTGGRDTAGLGGKGGPYRLDAGHKVHQLSDEEKDAVPDHVKQAAREMGRKAFKERLREIQMTEYDAEVYQHFTTAVSKPVQALRVILSNLQAKEKERQWLRHQTSGELDDFKLIEGITGERNIYRRRGEQEPELGAPQTKPKRLKLVVDVSGSMYRFNGHDGRLDRQMEAVVMVMEAFHGFQNQILYDIVGHSGEDYSIKFVESNNPPADNNQRLIVIKNMHAHAQFCISGDHTLEATQHAIENLSNEDCDEAIVIVLSDANLERYRIPAESFARSLTSHPSVNAYAIFIGSLGDQAGRLIKKLPTGRSFVCMDLKDIPQILKQIFTSSFNR